MDLHIYKYIHNYKTNGTYPDGYSRNEKTNFRRKANTFDVQGKTMLEHLLRTHGALLVHSSSLPLVIAEARLGPEMSSNVCIINFCYNYLSNILD